MSFIIALPHLYYNIVYYCKYMHWYCSSSIPSPILPTTSCMAIGSLTHKLYWCIDYWLWFDLQFNLQTIGYSCSSLPEGTHIHTCKLSIKMSGSEFRPRKVELTHMHSKNMMTTESILHITTKPVIVLTKTSFMAVIFVS